MEKTTSKTLWPWLIAMTLSSCIVTAQEHATSFEHYAALGDYRLIVMAGRGEQILGIELAAQQEGKLRCGIRYLPELTDVIKPGQQDKTHNLMSAAAQFNQRMLPHCLALSAKHNVSLPD